MTTIKKKKKKPKAQEGMSEGILYNLCCLPNSKHQLRVQEFELMLSVSHHTCTHTYTHTPPLRIQCVYVRVCVL